MANASETETLKNELKKALDQAEWSWLLKHAERDAVILVHTSLDLLDVGIKIAQDDTTAVAAWVGAHRLSKPTPAQLTEWNEVPTKKFQSLVVQPYVLIQEFVH